MTLPRMDQPTPSLDFPQRTVLTVRECAGALQVTEQQIINLIELGQLRALNVGSGHSKRCYRIPRGSWLGFLLERDTSLKP